MRLFEMMAEGSGQRVGVQTGLDQKRLMDMDMKRMITDREASMQKYI